LQVGIVSYTGLTLAASYFLFLHYDLLFFIKVIALALVAPLLVLLLLSLLIPKNPDQK